MPLRVARGTSEKRATNLSLCHPRHLYVENLDAVFEQAVSAGAKITMPLDDMFWGDRYGKLEDPFGHQWSVGTHMRDPSPEEMQKAMEQVGS